MELIFRLSVGEILRKMHTESSSSDMEQQELIGYLKALTQAEVVQGMSHHQLIFLLPSLVPYLLFPYLLPLPYADVSRKLYQRFVNSWLVRGTTVNLMK